MWRETVKEQSTAYVTATFKDKAGASAAPTSARYRIDCVTTGTMVRDWTTIASPAAAQEITLTPSDTAIQTSSNATETKRITVEATYGAGDQVVDEYDVLVANLSNYP